MAPLPMKTIEHFTHPNHQLFEIKNNDEYLCNGCNTFGIATRFRCHGCDFDLHEYCATCPMSLSSFMHSQHQLNLVVRKPEATRQNERICDVCGDNVEGIFYRCKLCEFDVHPLCTQLPQQVQHFLHPSHPLTLQPFSSSWCLVCKNQCTSWRYRCGICCIDIHLECLVIHCDASSSTSTSTPRSVRRPSAPAASPPPAFGAYAAPPFGIPYPYGIQATPFAANNYPYGVPFGFRPNNMYHQRPSSGNQLVGGGRFRKKMYKLVGSLTFGVVTSGLSAAFFGR